MDSPGEFLWLEGSQTLTSESHFWMREGQRGQTLFVVHTGCLAFSRSGEVVCRTELKGSINEHIWLPSVNSFTISRSISSQGKYAEIRPRSSSGRRHAKSKGEVVSN